MNRCLRFGAFIAVAATVTVTVGLVRGTAASAIAQFAAATDVPPSPPRSLSINRTNARLRVDQAQGISSKRVLFAPSNAGLAAVSGTPTEGETLTVGPGRWTGSKPIRYVDQWRRCTYLGSDCADIPGAKGPTYRLTASDVGATLRVRVTATNPAGSRGATSAPTAVVVPAAPKSVSLPTISGPLADGQVLTTQSGSWTGLTPMTFTYQWRRCQATGPICNDIAGATKQTYTLTASEVGAMLRVHVTAANAAGSSAATSAPTAVVAASPPTNTSLLAISGTAKQGYVLTAANGVWSGSPPMTFTYQWRRCDATGARCSDIAGETKQSYMLTASEVGGTIRVQVTAANSVGWSAATSAPVPVVAA